MPAPSAVNASAVVISDTSRVGFSDRPVCASTSSIWLRMRVPLRIAIRSEPAMSSQVRRRRFSNRPSFLPIADSELRMSVSICIRRAIVLETADAEFGVSRDHERQKLVGCDVEEIDLHVGMAQPVLREHRGSSAEATPAETATTMRPV